MKKLVLFVIIAVFSTIIVGCASMGSISSLKGQGHSRVYNFPYQTVWDAVPKAMQSLKLSVAVADEKEGKILTDTPLTFWSYGEAIAVFLTRIDDSHTKVEAVSRKKMGTNIFAFSYQDRILNALDKELGVQN
jgi:hypothetical protein